MSKPWCTKLNAFSRLSGDAGQFRSVFCKPSKKLFDAGFRETDARIGGTVVNVERVSIWQDRISARKNGERNVTLHFIAGFRPEYPVLPTAEARLRVVFVKEGQP